jgi:hypothetical protein
VGQGGNKAPRDQGTKAANGLGGFEYLGLFEDWVMDLRFEFMDLVWVKLNSDYPSFVLYSTLSSYLYPFPAV